MVNDLGGARDGTRRRRWPMKVVAEIRDKGRAVANFCFQPSPPRTAQRTSSNRPA